MAGEKYESSVDFLRAAFGVSDFDDLIDDDMLRSMEQTGTHTAWMFARGEKHVWYSCCRQKLTAWQLQARGCLWNVDAKAGRGARCPLCGRWVAYKYRGRLHSQSVDEEFHLFPRRTDTGELALIGVWYGTTWYDARPYEMEEDAELDHVAQMTPRALVMEVMSIPEKGAIKHFRRLFSYDQRPEGYWIKDGHALGSWGMLQSTAMFIRQSVLTNNVQDETYGVCHFAEIEGEMPTDKARYTWRALWEKRDALSWDWSMLALVKLALRSPNAEMLAKAGFVQLMQPHGWWRDMVNIRARRMDKVAPLDSNELARLRQAGKTLEPWMLIVPYWSKKLGEPVKLERGMAAIEKHTRMRTVRFQDGKVSQERSGYLCQEMSDFLRTYAPEYGLSRIVRYLNRLEPEQFITWRDTLRMLEDEERHDMSMVFPRDVEETHQRLIDRARARRNKPTDAKIAEIRKRLQKRYTFEVDGLRMEPFENAEEIFREGKVQHICIGTYAERYGDGQTILCKLRRIDAPDTPWHAVEFSKAGTLVQCRGFKNKTFPEDEEPLRAFWKAWDAARNDIAGQTLRITINKEAVTA